MSVSQQAPCLGRGGPLATIVAFGKVWRPPFPSPRPSPLARGSIDTHPSELSSRSDLPQRWMQFSLSLWERAGVRGKKAFKYSEITIGDFVLRT
jgi:hypothetical protein